MSLTTTYTAGSNVPGYLPDGVPQPHETFEDAKAALILMLDAYVEDCEMQMDLRDHEMARDRMATAAACAQYRQAMLQIEDWQCPQHLHQSETELSIMADGMCFWIRVGFQV